MKRYLCSLLLIATLLPLCAHSQSNEFTLIMDRIRAEQLATVQNVTTLDNGVTSTLASMQSNGSWPDVSYVYSATTYNGGTHLDRVKNFVLAYSHTGSSYYHSSSLFTAIVTALTYWDTADPQSWNWYHNQIYNPQRTGEILIILRIAPDTLPSTLYNNLLSQMNRGVPANQTGANKMDVAIHFIYRACLTENATLMTTGVSEVFQPLSYTTAEGIQYDRSFQQHGPQLYVFGYGSVLALGEVNMAVYLRGTSFAASSDKVQVLSQFLRKGYLPVMRGRYIDYSVNGRSISRVNNLQQLGTISLLNKWKLVDSAHATEYNNAVARVNGTQPISYNVTPSHSHFWHSDYTVHHRPGYFFGLRNVSTRTVKSENGNGENLKGYYLTDGATNIAVNGNEYYNIFPVWDWNKIPGTTVPAITTIPQRTAWGVNYGTAAFSGGVSDSLYGATGLAFSDYNTSARKGWFFFDDEIVCLGANVTSTAAQTINTTVNQCLLSGNVTVHAGGTTSVLSTGAFTYNNNLKWALHNNVGYYFPAGGNLQLSNQAQSGTWSSINTGGSTTTVTSNVFKLWFDHGVTPNNGSYAYIVLPGKATATDMQSYDTSRIKIMANTNAVQAVKHSTLNNWQLLFYEAASFSADGVTITVDHPCALMLKNVGTSDVTVYIADPAQTYGTINVTMKVPGIDSTRQLSCKLLGGNYAGQSSVYHFTNATPVFKPEGIFPVADAYVRSGSSYNTVNYGTATSLVLKNDVDGYAREIFFKFNKNSLPGTADSIKLKLHVNYANTDVSTTGWALYYVNSDSWTESGITWANMPATTSLLGTVTGKPSGSKAEWDVTSIVKNETDSLLTFKLVATNTGAKTDASFSSRETADAGLRPQLIASGTTSQQQSRIAYSGTATVKDVHIYPNPTTRLVTVETGKSFEKATVYNGGGQLLKTQYITGQTKFQVDLQNYPAGIYFLHLHSSTKPVVIKVMKTE